MWQKQVGPVTVRAQSSPPVGNNPDGGAGRESCIQVGWVESRSGSHFSSFLSARNPSLYYMEHSNRQKAE